MGGVRTLGMMMISLWWAPNFNFKISRYLYFMVTIFENKDATTRYAGKGDGQTLVETAGSPGRDTSAGHMKLDNVFVFVGMNPELRIVAEIRLKSVFSTSPSGCWTSSNLTCRLLHVLMVIQFPGFTVARNVYQA